MQPSVKAVFAALMIGMFGASVPGQPILQTSGASLTHSLPDTSATIQNVQLRTDDRGVNVDGTGRLQAFFPGVVGDPYESVPCELFTFLGDVNVFSGAYAPTDIDLLLPMLGTPWPVARTYSTVQGEGDPTVKRHDSNGYQGYNWFHSGHPVLVEAKAAVDGNDQILLIWGADRYSEFVSPATESPIEGYKGKNGTAGVITKSTNTPLPDTFTYTDQRGNRYTFIGFANFDSGTNPVTVAGVKGQLWKAEDAAGHIAYVGSTTLTDPPTGFDSSGRITTAYDASGRKYSYTYSTIGSAVDRLTQVKAETLVGSAWVEVGRVDYAYYASDQTGLGSLGDLKLVTITTPTSDGGSAVRQKYYRYYTDAYDDSTGRRGAKHFVKLVLGFEGARQYDLLNSTFDQSYDSSSVTDDTLKPYADSGFEYTSDGRVCTAFFSGRCGCAGGSGAGTYTLSYGVRSSYSTMRGNTSYDYAYSSNVPAWARSTTITQPDGTIIVQYFDEVGQPLSKVQLTGTPDSPTKKWVTEVVRDSNGQISEVRTPSVNSTWAASDGAITASASAGLVRVYSRVTSGDAAGLLQSISHRQGTGGTAASPVTWSDYTVRAITSGVSSLYTAVPLVYHTRVYPDASSTSTYYETTLSYSDWYSATDSASPLYAAPRMVTIIAPIVGSTANGDTSATTTVRYLRRDGSTAFTQDAAGILNYSGRDGFGQVIKRIEDCQTSSSDFLTGDNPASDFGMTPSGSGHHIVTDITYDQQGRADSVTVPAFKATGSSAATRTSKTYYTSLLDRRQVSFTIPLYIATSGTSFGPVRYSVGNLAGRSETEATIALPDGGSTLGLSSWVSSSSSDAIAAISSTLRGSSNVNLAGISSSLYDKAGTQPAETRAYSTSAFAGASSTDYDATTYTYDSMGRLTQVTDPTGTIRKFDYDERGMVWQTSSGVGSSLTVVEKLEFDGGAGGGGGNGLLTKRTLDADGNWSGTSDQRVTQYTYDYRNRLVIQANPAPPHTLLKLDNLGRPLAVGQYSSTSGLTTATDPTSTASARIGLAETRYDPRGQVYQSVAYGINQSTGATDGSITSDFWYDKNGRQIKTIGPQLIKARYDRLGRPTNRFVLGMTSGSSYADAGTLTNDKVLEETQTAYDNSENSGLPVMQVSVSRIHNDFVGTGALDSNADADPYTVTAGDLSGRVQITAMWYDELGRQTSVAQYGTNGGGTFARRASGNWIAVPTSGANSPVTSTAYDGFGRVKDVTDAAGTVSRTLYDAANRKVADIRNYTAGSNLSTAVRDNDVYTRYVYTNGLMTRLFVDLNGDGTANGDDQITDYVYGVSTSGTPASDSASGVLLAQVVYPPGKGGSSTADRSVHYAYNAQGEQKAVLDQNGTTRTTTFDTAGRRSAETASLASGSAIDNRVLKVGITYTDRGQVEAVTQYDGSNAVTDQVGYEYDSFGVVKRFQQDRNSAISGGSDYAEVAYDTGLVAPTGSGWVARAGVRRTAEYVKNYSSSLQTVQTVSYDFYTSGTGITIQQELENAAGRVVMVRLGSAPVATYQYLGAAHLVGAELPLTSGSVASRLHDNASTPAYDALDRFNRITSSRWVNSSGSTLYRVDVAYDTVGNILSQDDFVLKGRDVKYDMDGLHRLKRAEEGTLASGSITGATRQKDERWTDSSGSLGLSQTGNWLRHLRDLSGGQTFNELDDTGTFTKVNEIDSRSVTVGGSTSTVTPNYDKAGNLIDDGENYKFAYDAWGRLVKVTNRASTPATVAEYRYNGLGFRIGWHYDADTSGTVDGSDPWYWFVYNERWQMMATWRCTSWTSGTDQYPKETFINHAAGFDGSSNSSYIDSVARRDSDTNSTAWTSAGASTRGSNLLYLQNWRADVVVTTTAAGTVVDRLRYSAYGVPDRISLADICGIGGAGTVPDGLLTGDDYIEFMNAFGSSGSLADIVGTGGLPPSDGSVTGDDYTAFVNAYGSDANIGRGVLSEGLDSGNRRGYAGYEFDPVLVGSKCHVRNRVYGADAGRWDRRDPLGNVDGPNLYRYANGQPISRRDASGLSCSSTWPGPQSIAPSPSDGSAASPPADDEPGFMGPPKSCGPDITSWLVAVMNLHITDSNVTRSKQCRESKLAWLLLKPLCEDGIDYAASYIWLYEHVKPGGVWDFKTSESFVTSDCPRGCSYTVTLCGKCVNWDVAGNIHYGFLAAKMGFDNFITCHAPGPFQARRRGQVLPNLLDDPLDTHAIKIGIDLGEGSPFGVDQASLCAMVNGSLSSLNREGTHGCRSCSQQY